MGKHRPQQDRPGPISVKEWRRRERELKRKLKSEVK